MTFTLVQLQPGELVSKHHRKQLRRLTAQLRSILPADHRDADPIELSLILDKLGHRDAMTVMAETHPRQYMALIAELSGLDHDIRSDEYWQKSIPAARRLIDTEPDIARQIIRRYCQ